MRDDDTTSNGSGSNGSGARPALGDDAFVLRALQFLDGLLDDDAVAAFNEELKSDAARRESYVRNCELRGHHFK